VTEKLQVGNAAEDRGRPEEGHAGKYQ